MPMAMSASRMIASGQIVGDRERQEDALATARLHDGGKTLALVLADGMGGHAGGDVASHLAVKTVLGHLGEAGPAQLTPAIFAANDAIARAMDADTALDGMGCTLVAATVQGAELRWASVGDSALLLLRRGQLSRLNADHSMRGVLAEMVAAGRLTAEEAARAPTRNALRSAVSGEEIDLIDAPDDALPLAPGDLVLLISDGVETLSTAEIAAIADRAAARGARRVAGDLLAAVDARRAPHQDNASVIAYLHGGRATGKTGWILPTAVAACVLLLLGLWTALVEWDAEHPRMAPAGHHPAARAARPHMARHTAPAAPAGTARHSSDGKDDAPQAH
jgi:serine/threonine protein phosphatase PrpC